MRRCGGTALSGARRRRGRKVADGTGSVETLENGGVSSQHLRPELQASDSGPQRRFPWLSQDTSDMSGESSAPGPSPRRGRPDSPLPPSQHPVPARPVVRLLGLLSLRPQLRPRYCPHSFLTALLHIHLQLPPPYLSEM